MTRARAIELLKSDLTKAPNNAKVNGLIDDLLRAIRGLPERPSTRQPFEGLFGPSTPTDSKKLTLEQYEKVGKEFGIEAAVLRAVVDVECAGRGFLPSGRPTILFEAPWFDEFTNGQWRKSHPDISTAANWAPELYKGGEKEWDRYAKAAALNRNAARLSISMGLGQIMGFNYRKAGFATVDAFFEAMHSSEFEQLRAMMRFIDKSGLLGALRSKDWVRFAKSYNGPLYYENKYDQKLQKAYQKFSS